MSGLRSFIDRFWRDESGTSTIEFVIIVPVFFTFMFMGVELGVTMTRQVMLDRAVDISVRDLRLGRLSNPNLTTLRKSICDAATGLQDCETNLFIELRRVNMTTWNYPTARPGCINRAEQITPPDEITGGGSNDLMILRACLIIDPLFPTSPMGMGLPLDASGGYQLFAISAFVNEPRI